MNRPRRILSVVLVLGLALGTVGFRIQTGMMAGIHEIAAAAANGPTRPMPPRWL